MDVGVQGCVSFGRFAVTHLQVWSTVFELRLCVSLMLDSALLSKGALVPAVYHYLNQFQHFPSCSDAPTTALSPRPDAAVTCPYLP